jgi:hypothetical protein
MKTLLSLLMKPVGILTTLAMVFVLSGAGYMKASGHLSPGPISSTHPKEQPINGYVSHADFEKECGHCHAPVHCVTDTRCQDCHKNVAQQRIEAKGLHGKLPGTDRCQNCHVEHQGREVVITQFAFPNVDHKALAGFSLASHRVNYQEELMNCESCHSQDRFANETLDCLTCHIQEDHDYISSHVETYGVDCVPCHDGTDRMRDFEHELAYPLDGAHADAECEACHAEKVFSGTTQDCSGCHEDPDIHAGKFGLDCERCHSTLAWNPAQLVRHTFFLDHGSQTNTPVECVVCHQDTMVVNSCYGCHDHQPAEMDQVHLDEGIAEYTTCEQCHPTGQKGEAAAIMAEQSSAANFQLIESLFSTLEDANLSEQPVYQEAASTPGVEGGGIIDDPLSSTPEAPGAGNGPGQGLSQEAGPGSAQGNQQQTTPQAPAQGPGNGYGGK